MAITTIKQYPNTITVGVSKINGYGNLLVSIEDADDGNSYTHKMYFVCGEYSYESGYFSTNNSVMTEYEFPLEWANAITSSTSRVGTFKVETYKKIGLLPTSLVETNTRNVTFKVPDTVIPTMPGLTIERINESVPSAWDMYVQGYSKCQITASAQGAYSSTIKNYRFALNGAVLSNQTSGTYTYLCESSGTLDFTVTATDSRGRTVTQSASITVEKYSKPIINKVTCFRSDADGNGSDEGTYITGKIEYSFSSLNENNLAICKASYKTDDSSWSAETEITNNTQMVLFSGEFDVNVSYQVRFKVSDSLSYAEYIYDLSTSYVLMDFLKGGKGIAFGKVAEISDAMDVNFLLLLRNGMKAGDQTFPLVDTGWQTLPLADGISTGNLGITPKYRRFGNSVYISGDVKGITEARTTIGTLPEGVRPTREMYCLCHAPGTNIINWIVQADGQIVIEYCYKLSDQKYNYEINSYTLNINYLI